MFNHRQGYIIRADNGIIILHPDSMSDEIKPKSEITLEYQLYRHT